MDEVLFRSSQKLESLQMQLGLAASEGKNILQQYSQQSKAFASEIWGRLGLEKLKENLHQLWLVCVTLSKEIRRNATEFPKTVFDSFIKALGKQWTKQNMCFAAIGFIVGGIVGISIGVALKRTLPYPRYMQAVQCTSYDGIEFTTVMEDAIAPFECEKNEVLVNVKAASVQVVDAQICAGYGRTLRQLLSKYFKYSSCDLPVTLGRDCTGVITDIGQSVTRLEVGDEVWLTVPFWAPGTMCQTVLVTEHRVAKKPRNIGFEGATSLPYAGTVALNAIEKANINDENAKYKRILIHNGCTPVGCVLIQILKLWGSHITTTCYKRAVPVAKALRADEIIVIPENETANETKTDLEVPENKTVNKQLELQEGFNVIFNTKDCKLGNINLESYCTSDGVVISTQLPHLSSDSCGFISRSMLRLFVTTKCFFQMLFTNEIRGFGEPHVCYVMLDQLKNFVEDGVLQTVVDKVFHPQEIEIALRHIQSTESIGSSVVTFR